MDIHGLVPLLQVFDMPTAIRFYRDVLGFTIVNTSEPGDDCHWAWLKLNGAEVMVKTAYEKEHRPSSPDPARVASHGDTCLFFGCKDLEAAYQHLRARRLESEGTESRSLRDEAVVVFRSRWVRAVFPMARFTGE